MTISDITSARHYTWGEVCDGWHLLQNPELSVIQERVPPGKGEVRHFHNKAQQFFYVLSGTASLEFDDRIVTFSKGQGVHVPAQVPHRFANDGADDVVFLVISTPPTAVDRINLSA
jgi:mannose-6-phosphate isomerase-like protein (cupin superfamily)